MSEILKMFELAQQNRVSQVEIGRSRIESSFHAQRLARSQRPLQFRAQLGFFHNLRRALLDVRQLLVNRWKVCHALRL